MKIKHPYSEALIEGTVLEPGVALQPGRDFFSSDTGAWLSNTMPGWVPSEDVDVVWVRIPDLMAADEALGKERPAMFRDDSGFEFG